MQPHGFDLFDADNTKRALDLKIESLDNDAAIDEGEIIELLAKHIHFCEVCRKG